ncbi:hypothetical protein MSAN_00130100 [Mycena sanguinolenta]|uniref:Uncharacterized protein n=1 Tax=Mycena sanguinolenta TaxID=230812 RepID=A0A8H7DMZ1_9AGAR|nr:hypothetical protein MSAN_00130100 [Mycena sanguinolenta]
MDDQPNPEFIHSTNRDLESPTGMFSHSQQFTVTGGTFTNIANHNYAASPSLLSDFRMIPMGDIDLRHQIRVDKCTGVVHSQPRKRAGIRRANIDASISPPLQLCPSEQYFIVPAILSEDSAEIAFLPSTEAPRLGEWTILERGTGKVMPNGWTRYFFSGDVIDNALYLSFTIFPDRYTWLSQANHMFRRLHLSDFEDYVVVDAIFFFLDILETARDPPMGFLFLCPKEDFQTGSSSFCWPACPAYWSLDPSGIDRLSPGDATEFGFPTLELTTEVLGDYWDDSVYEGLRQFHQARGFDPYSQNIALHLDLPLFQLSSEVDALFAYVGLDGEDSDADIDSDCNSPDTQGYEPEYSLISARDDPDPDVDAVTVPNEEEVHHPLSRHDGSEHQESNCGSQKMFAPSRSSNVLMSIQLVLISFLGLSWVYDHVSVSRGKIQILKHIAPRIILAPEVVVDVAEPLLPQILQKAESPMNHEAVRPSASRPPPVPAPRNTHNQR